MISDDYFFDMAPPSGNPTILFELQPYGMRTGGIESLDAYIIRLAKVHKVTVRVLFDHLLNKAVYGNSNRDAWRNIRSSAWSIIGGTGHWTHRWVSVLSSLTGRDDLQGMTLVWMDEVIASQGLIGPAGRYCSSCIEEHIADGSEPFNRLIWRMKTVTACPIHGVLLRQHKCMKLNSHKSNMFVRAQRAGYCSICGQLVYHCDPSPTVQASNQELWIANQISELLELGSKGGILIRSNLITGIKKLAAEVSHGHHISLAKQCGLPKSLLSSLVNGNDVRVSMPTILRLCSRTGCNVVSLLTGSPMRQEQIDLPLSDNRIFAFINYSNAEVLLKEAISSTGPKVTLGAIASVVGAKSSKSIRMAFPELCAELCTINRMRQANLKQQMIHDQEAECDRIMALLDEQGLNHTLRNVGKITGKRPVSKSSLGRAFLKRRR